MTLLCMTLRKTTSSSWQLMASGMFCATKRWPIWSGASLQKTEQILTGNTSLAFVFLSREPKQTKSRLRSPASRSAPARPCALFCDPGNCLLTFPHPKATITSWCLPILMMQSHISMFFLRDSATLNQTLHFFHPQVFRTGQVLGMQSKGKEERPPVDAG